MIRKTTVLGLVVGVVLAMASSSAAQATSDNVRITVLSSRPDFVTGGDALIEVTTPPAAAVRITVNDRDVSAKFRERQAGIRVGLVDGLADGQNVLSVTAGSASGRVALINHPINGPVLSGPSMVPFVCMTEESGLGKPLDANC